LNQKERGGAEQFREKFLKNGAHDLRMPLSIIKESLNLLLEGVAGDLTGKQKNMLSTAKNNVDKAAVMIDDLIKAARDEGAKDGRRECFWWMMIRTSWRSWGRRWSRGGMKS
jgi:signal transduction histidine kinase